MLNQIQFHIHEDEKKQQDIERALAQEIRDNYRLSIGAFERFMPSLAELVKTCNSAVSTLLCNKYAEINIVNYNSGQVVYGMHPKQEVLFHLDSYIAHFSPVKIPLTTSTTEEYIEAVICLGLGLGHHLEHLVESSNYKHIVVYEANIDYFICSLSCIRWQSIFQKAKEQGIALYLQVGSDATNFVSDINELVAHVGVNKIQLYKHFNLPVFNSLEEKLYASNWSELQGWIPKNATASLNESYLPIWAPLNSQYGFEERFLDEKCKLANLNALKKYFPDLYDEFSSYTPQRWCPVASSDGTVNVVHKNTHSLFSISPKSEANTSFELFSRKPNKDGLLLSYKGKKLKGYLHYQLVEACESIIEGVNEEQGELPEHVKSLIMFGIGSGYSVEALMSNHDTGMLFICEPNKDFFYASLYAIDWARIIETFDEGKKRLYLNIGDDGSNLTNDLLVQFQTVGPYMLANTFFYQTYVNDKLTDAVAQLREQLLVIIAMGDYFDNANFGIAHTHTALEKSIPFLLANTCKKLPQEVFEVPVFVVGNGPSLDGLIDTLKLENDKAIVISCGTALQSLYNNGITPDFHAEIETNRSTFDWLSRIEDSEYLRNITLLSCNGIHPDTTSLFKRTLLAFKQGEASTVSLTELDKKHPFALLEHAYPTVTNFVSDLVTTIGFKQIYLFGTDMGFVSDTYHHSRSSGYYDGEGKELYRYADNHSMSLVIPGNFKPWVKTKYEFKVSKSVLELTFTKAKVDVYNLNDGARITGAQPLDKALMLVSATSEQKAFAINTLVSDAFSSKLNLQFVQNFDEKYSTHSLLEELSALTRLLDGSFETVEDVAQMISDQREFIVASYRRGKSLAFYYLNGTINYVNSMFSKLLNINDNDVVVSTANAVLNSWRRILSDIHLMIENYQYGFDNISPFSGIRRTSSLKEIWQSEPIGVTHRNKGEAVPTVLTRLAASTANDSKRNVSLNWIDDQYQPRVISKNTCNIIKYVDQNDFETPFRGVNLISKGSFLDPTVPLQSNDVVLTNIALIALMSELNDVIFLPKASFHPLLSSDFFNDVILLSERAFCYSGPDYIVLTNSLLSPERLFLKTGDRLVYVPSLRKENFRYEEISAQKYLELKETVRQLNVVNEQ